MTRLIIGAMVRAIGAYPSGWRYPGAHRDPRGDAAVLRRAAQVAEEARLDFLFFGDWLATGHDLEFRDPHLVARVDPLSAVAFLAGVTERIGLVATVNSTYADPFTVARASASVDLLSGGRAALNLVTGSDARSAANHGVEFTHASTARYDRAVEFQDVLRRLWDSFEDEAIVADAASGVFLDPSRVHATEFAGEHFRVAGPLNVVRPVQGHLPIVHAGSSPSSQAVRRPARRPRPRGGVGARPGDRGARGAALAGVRVGTRRPHPQGHRAGPAHHRRDPGARAVHRRRAQRAGADRRGLARRAPAGVPGRPIAGPALDAGRRRPHRALARSRA